MSKLAAILPAVATVSLLTVGGCATRDDVTALRSEVAALHAATEPAGADVKALRSDVAALRAAIESAGTGRASCADVEALRSDIMALHAAVEAAGATHATGGPTAASAAASNSATAHRTARAGPSNVARMPSPVCFTTRP